MGEPAQENCLLPERVQVMPHLCRPSDRWSTFFCTPCSLVSWPKLFLMAAKDGTTVVDEVARQAMWAEVIKKENATIGAPHRFFLNPNKLVFIARKPTEVDPRTYEADSLSAGEQCPAGEVSGRSLSGSGGQGGAGGGRQDKDDPLIDASSAKLWDTEAQRWGNFYGKARPPGVDPFSSQRSCWKKPRSKCDVTEYGDRYCEMTGVSPYARKHLDAGSKT